MEPEVGAVAEVDGGGGSCGRHWDLGLKGIGEGWGDENYEGEEVEVDLHLVVAGQDSSGLFFNEGIRWSIWRTKGIGTDAE